MKNSLNINQRRCARNVLLIVGFIVVLSTIVFRNLFAGDSVLFMTDNNVGIMADTKEGAPSAFMSGFWTGGPLIGMEGPMPVCLANLLLWALPILGYVNWFHALMMSLASLGFALFCFRRGCRTLPVMLGLMAAFWLGSSLTLTYSGHNGKYGVLAFAGLGLWLIEMAASRKRIAWSILTGGAVGMMFVEQQDVALLVGMFLGAYAVYAIFRENAGNWRMLWLPLILMAFTALLVGGQSVLSGYMSQVKGVGALSDENPQQKWDFCTSWSLPPEDMLEFIAPGFRGTRTGELESPYWGRMGRTPGWEQTRQGFQNFKLNSEYVGAIPIGLALFALMLAVMGKPKGRDTKSSVRRPRPDGRHRETELRGQVEVISVPGSDPDDGWALSKRRGDVIFLGMATLVALLLAFGRFFPLYRLFYQLPGMSSIRCPQKFIHVFQIGLGILVAFGADALLRGIPDNLAKWSRRFGVIMLVLAGLLLLWTGSLVGSRETLINGFASEGWSRYAPVMVDNMVRGAFHAALLTLVVGGGLLLLVAWRQRKMVWRYGVMSALVLMVMVDVVLLSRDYIKVVSFQEVAGENIVTSFLKENLKQQRVYMLTQEGFYNNWLTELFPYHHIETFNVSQMPRMPVDYERWLKTVGRDPVRLWQLSAIGYMLAPEQIWQQIQKEPRLASHFESVKGFNVYSSGTGVSIVEAPTDKSAGHRILRFKSGLPRFKLFHEWGVSSDDVVGERLSDRAFNPLAKVWISDDTAGGLPSHASSTNSDHEVLDSCLSAMDAKVIADVASPAVLMFVNKHSVDWCVDVDGKTAPLLRCNSLCLGVYLEPGKHEIRFYLRNQWGLLLTEIIGLLACLGAIIWLIFNRSKQG